MRFLFWCVTLTFFLLVSSAKANDRLEVGDAIFTVPAGWSLAKRADRTAQLAHRTGKHVTGILVVSGQPLRGSLRQTFLQSIKTSGVEVDVRPKRIHEARSPFGYDVIYLKETFRRPGAKRGGHVIFVGANPGGRYESATLVAPGGMGRQTLRARQAEFRKFIRGLRYKSAGGANADPLKPPEGAGGLEGLYYASTLGLSPNLFGETDAKVRQKRVLFFRDGRVYRDIPSEGRVKDFDFAKACTESPKGCAIYRLEGDQIVFDTLDNYGFLVQEAKKLKKKGARMLKIGGDVFHQIIPARKNFRLDGRYVYFAYSGSVGQGPVDGGVSAAKSIRFTSDGRFESTKVKAVFADMESTSASGSTRDSGTGRYVIEGYTLTLMYDDGTVDRVPFYPESEKEHDLVFLNGKGFRKK